LHSLRIIPLSTAILMTGILLLGSAEPMLAQRTEPRLDLAVTYTAGRSLHANTTQEFWMNGGSVELGGNVWKGWGIAADVTGMHTASIGTTGIPLSLVTSTFGPRYRWHAQRRISPYGQALVGEANGFRSLFPATSGAQPDANGLALQIGGGLDYRLKGRFAIRLLDAGWVRTQLPNSTNNIQNILRLGGGAVLRF
jgi:hypothetical protein